MVNKPCCEVHNREMEWVEDEVYPEGGYWVCVDCLIAEESRFE